MSTQNLKDKEDLILPLKWKPGEDCMSKLLLSDPKIINLVVHSLVDASIPANSYIPAQTEWTDTKGVYTLYASREKNDDRFAPVLVAVHEEVTHATMLDTIEYCTMVYGKFRLLPTVLIISINGSSSLMDDNEFSVVDDLFLVQCKSNFWARKCFLFFPGSVNKSVNNTPRPSLTSLCQFICNPSKTLIFHHNLETETISLTCEVVANRK
ncbi:unnamed protein product [Mucor circinelloides]